MQKPLKQIDGVVREITDEEYERYIQIVEEQNSYVQPLSDIAVLATLLAVIGAVSVQDAANAVHLMPEDLIAEAQAWAVASTQ